MQLPLRIILDRVMALSDMIALTRSFEFEMILRDEIDLYLKKSGWTEDQFERALLELIDSQWNDPIN